MSTAEKSSPVTDRRRRGSTREKMVRTAAVLLREHGVAGTTIDRVLAVSGAPRGSVYHHFPGGRAQLLSEAVEFATDSIIELAGAAGEGDPAVALDAFVALWREQLVASDYRAGCPVLAVVVDSDPALPELTEQAGEAFGRWQSVLARMLGERGMAATSADRLALQSLCILEGAVAVSRARRGISPLDEAAQAIRTLYEAEVNRAGVIS
ncbi:TetR/AcrR family transcriptional regulator [Dietzia aerolata]|uniref:TetR/AcrR family transcriptional regulator n=1 Tax=Dietzia aerolata TaxID=595984 RepID=A0ABV5JMG0_9ACTN|nr:TetR/AcrR family transcriptional regulator [Dietzia aerolata]